MSAVPAARLPTSLEQLPLVTLYLSERCNSRCVTCDYWRYGKADVSLAQVLQLMPALRRLKTQLVLLSGGEPLLNPEWAQIAAALRDELLKLWLLTSGLSLAKHAARVAQLFDTVTVSLDGTQPATYAHIRGLDAFDKVCAGIRAASSRGVPVTLRVTLQRANYRELPRFVDLARELGARQISFLAVDVANPHAFARRTGFVNDAALSVEDLPHFERLLGELERTHAADFASGFIAESPAKLHRLLRYFSAVCAQGEYPPVRCNAPEFSAVLDASGGLHPCFFIPGPAGPPAHTDFEAALNAPALRQLREHIRAGTRAECRTCVCSVWHTRGSTSRVGPSPVEAEYV